jgi:hypothetical protein
LLMWMSELGAGTWQRFRDACAWEFRFEPEGSRPSASLVAAHLAQRGYAEFDFGRRRWAIAPTVVATVPGLHSAGIVVGGRTRTTIDYWGSLDDPDVYLAVQKDPPASSRSRRVSPLYTVRTVFVIADYVTTLERAAAPMGATFAWDAGPALARHLPRLSDTIIASPRMPPPPDAQISRYDATTGWWEDVSAATEVGFYRFRPRRMVGPTQFRLISSVGAHDVDRSVGIYAALERASAPVLAFESADINGFFHVRADAALPTLHARALFLCSGLPPTEVSHPTLGSSYRYVNIPLDVAERVADALNQPLQATSQLIGPSLPIRPSLPKRR